MNKLKQRQYKKNAFVMVIGLHLVERGVGEQLAPKETMEPESVSHPHNGFRKINIFGKISEINLGNKDLTMEPESVSHPHNQFDKYPHVFDNRGQHLWKQFGKYVKI